MRTHIDWLTFTIPMIYFGDEANDYARAVESGFEDMFGAKLRGEVFGERWEIQERSRAPYTDAWVQATMGITLFASPNLTHACVEISGSGCERLISEGKLSEILVCCKERVTRIDIACDIETTVMPTEFVKEMSHERMRTSGQVISDTGETCYVGSQKSERYARVYRYNAPHPRAHLLRVEHIFRKDYAKKVANSLVRTSLEGIAKSAGLAFGWKHAEWKPDDVEAAEISLVSERRDTGKTVHWLVTSCASAFKRLCADGTIKDPDKFLETYF
jgi:hypothetical protein